MKSSSQPQVDDAMRRLVGQPEDSPIIAEATSSRSIYRHQLRPLVPQGSSSTAPSTSIRAREKPLRRLDCLVRPSCSAAFALTAISVGPWAALGVLRGDGFRQKSPELSLCSRLAGFGHPSPRDSRITLPPCDRYRRAIPTTFRSTARPASPTRAGSRRSCDLTTTCSSPDLLFDIHGD